MPPTRRFFLNIKVRVTTQNGRPLALTVTEILAFKVFRKDSILKGISKISWNSKKVFFRKSKKEGQYTKAVDIGRLMEGRKSDIFHFDAP